MAGPDITSLTAVGATLESGLVYGITLIAAVYLARTIFRIFVPRRRRGVVAPSRKGCEGCSKGCSA